MMDCMIIGDSIAVGTHQFKTECVAHAKGGLNTWQWNKRFSGADLHSKVMVISLGTNDHPGVKTPAELRKMRDRVKAERVYWIMPPCNSGFCKPDVNEAVLSIAKAHGDVVIGTQRLQPDRIHPSWAGYKELAKQVQ